METRRRPGNSVLVPMTEDQEKKLIAYVRELAQQHNALEKRVAELECRNVVKQ